MISIKKYIRRVLFFLGCFFIPVFSLWANSVSSDSNLTHDMMMLVFQLSVIIIAARIGGSLIKKINLPRVLGEIVAGMLIGPYLLGGISLPGFADGLFAIHGSFPISNELYGFTTVAAIVLLFLVGLETDLDTFLSYSAAGSGVGIGGVVVSFIFGNVATVIGAKLIFGDVFTFLDPIPLFMGGISTATSVGISARILSENRKLHSPEGVTILSGAVIDDVLGIICLAIVLGIVKQGHVDWSIVSMIAIKAIVIWLGCSALGLIFSRQLGALLNRFQDKTTISVMSIAFAFILAGVFEQAGLAMIIGSYIMGLSLSKTDLTYLLQDKLEVIQQFFVPIFFCVTGMLVNFHDILSLKMIEFGFIFVFFGIAGKMIGCGVPALLLNFNLRGALRIGIGMTPRGEVTMIIAGIGLSNGILHHEYFGIVIIMTFVTTLITPPIFSRMLNSDKPVLKKDRDTTKAHEEIVFDMPNEDTAGFLVSKTIEAFENEGFYIHRMHSTPLYKIRKDRMFITMKPSAEKLIFDCLSKDVAFIHTLFYEVLAELEHLMKNIQALSYKEQIGKKIFENGNGKHSNNDHLKKKESIFTKLNNVNSVSVNIKSSDKKGIIGELLDLLIDSEQLKSSYKEEALKEVLEREESMSTGMQNGIALPHARTDVVSDLVFVVGVRKEGVDFDSLDGKPSSIFVLILSPKSAGQPQLFFLSQISKIFFDKSNIDKILSCKRDFDLYNTLRALTY